MRKVHIRSLVRHLVLATLLVFPCLAMGQISGADPFLGNYDLGKSCELIMIWSEPTGDQCNQKIFDFLGATNIVLPKPQQSETGEAGMAGGRSMAVIADDFDGDRKDDLVVAWEGAGRSICLVMPQINSGTLDWTERQLTTIPAGSLNEHSPHHIRLVPADFDADPEKEFVLAYWAADGSIRIVLYDTDGSLIPTAQSEISNETLNWSYLGDGATCFDVAIGNFDRDCFDEIVLIGVDPVMPTHWSLFARVYDVNPDTYAITAKGRHGSIYQDAANPDYLIRRLVVSAVDLNNDYFDDVVVGFQVWKSESAETHNYLQPFQVDTSLSHFTIDPSKRILQATYPPGLNNYGYPMDIVTGDLNVDGRAEIVSTAMRQANVYTSDDDFNLYEVDEIGLATQYWDDSRGILILDDLDADPDDSLWLPEILVTENRWVTDHDQFRIRVFETALDSDNDRFIDSVHLRSVWENDLVEVGLRQMAVAAGDFNGDGIRLGTPQRYQKTEILQPTIILNAPPIHFDMFAGSDTVDVNGCFEGTCGFRSVYETESTYDTAVVTEVSSDWGIDGSIKGNWTYMGAGIKFNLSAHYGENFSKIAGMSQSITTGVRVTATYDDRIFATTATYDIWEYPVYLGESHEGYLVVVDPAVTKSEWFASKSWTAQSYVPNHEVGNLLSYQQYVDLSENEDAARALKMTDSYGIDASSSYDWWLRMIDFETQDSMKSWAAGIEVGGSISGGGLEVGLSGSYDKEEIKTHKTSVENALSLEVYLGSIKGIYSEAGHSITPNAYWAKNGALVIDYSVDLALSGPGGAPTWWKTHYEGAPDYSFILPWKFDPEKGFDLEDETKRSQTNDISFYPPEYSKGDTITISARVHNYSLTNASNPVTVRFYLGDPGSGGTPIVGTGGETEVTTDNVVVSRGMQTVHMDWQIPLDVPHLPKIYAVIDPDDLVDEIHEYNNKGYRVLVVSGDPTGILDGHDDGQLPESFSLHDAYPNPFNPGTTIEYALRQPTEVNLSIYNVLGQRVVTLQDGVKSAGRHLAVWNGQDDRDQPVASGVYLYRLTARGQSSTKKLVLLK